ncbi:MAG: hypothetical protein GY721_09385 [Deltaproteobacteria bacterium]|nr:hypothetical protein [Deltaproteobacteria bacterium]
MVFSIPIEISFEVIDQFLKKEIPYKKHEGEEEPEEMVLELDIDDDYVDEATGIVDSVAKRFNIERTQQQ